MIFDDFVLSTTQDELVPKVVDSVTKGNVLLARLMNAPEAGKIEGHKKVIPIQYKQASNGGPYAGMDVFSTDQVNTRVNAEYEIRGYEQPITISGMDLSANATRGQVIDLMAAELQRAKIEMLDGIGDTFYGDGTGSSNKAFVGLAAAVDDGSGVSTYAGLSRSTYENWKATLINASSVSSGKLTLSVMADLYMDVAFSSQHPTLGVTTKDIWNFYESLLQPTVRANYQTGGFPMIGRTGGLTAPGALGGDMGFTALNFRGMPIVFDDKCTSGKMFFLNENYINWAGVEDKTPGNTNIVVAGEGPIDSAGIPANPITGFAWTGWIKPSNQNAITGHYLLHGNIICSNPRNQGCIENISSV